MLNWLTGLCSCTGSFLLHWSFPAALALPCYSTGSSLLHWSFPAALALPCYSTGSSLLHWLLSLLLHWVFPKVLLALLCSSLTLRCSSLALSCGCTESVCSNESLLLWWIFMKRARTYIRAVAWSKVNWLYLGYTCRCVSYCGLRFFQCAIFVAGNFPAWILLLKILPCAIFAPWNFLRVEFRLAW